MIASSDPGPRTAASTARSASAAYATSPPSIAADSPLPRLPAIDGLRGVALIAVIVAHFCTLTGAAGASQLPLAFGSTGVRLLFVVSGFVITRVLLREIGTTGGLCLRSFWLRRASRIVPALAVYLVTLVLLSRLAIVAPLGDRELACTLLFVKNFSPCSGGWNLAHLWTLSIEEQYYLAWPTLIAVVLHARAPSLRWQLTLWLGLAWTVSVGMAFSGAWLLPGVFRHAPFLACGALLALHEHALSAAARRLGRLCGPALLAALSLQALFPLLDGVADVPPVRYLVNPALCAVTVLLVCADTPVSRLLALKPLVMVGTISYSLYLWQQLFLANPADFSLNAALRPEVSLLLGVATAYASYQLVERPFRSWGRQLSAVLRRRNAPAMSRDLAR